MRAAPPCTPQSPFWFPMIVVREREISGRERRRQERAAQAKARAERNAEVIALFRSGRTSGQVALRLGIGVTTVRNILTKAGVTWREGGAHVRAQKLAEKTPQRIELERLIRKRRRFLPPGFRTAADVLARINSIPLTTAG